MINKNSDSLLTNDLVLYIIAFFTENNRSRFVIAAFCILNLAIRKFIDKPYYVIEKHTLLNGDQNYWV